MCPLAPRWWYFRENKKHLSELGRCFSFSPTTPAGFSDKLVDFLLSQLVVQTGARKLGLQNDIQTVYKVGYRLNSAN